MTAVTDAQANLEAEIHAALAAVPGWAPLVGIADAELQLKTAIAALPSTDPAPGTPTPPYFPDADATGVLALPPAQVGQPWTYQLHAVNPDGKPLRYEVAWGGIFASLTAGQGVYDPATGLITGYSPATGNIAFTFRAWDDADAEVGIARGVLQVS